MPQLGEDQTAPSVTKNKAKRFLKFLTKKDVMQFALLLHDIVSALSNMSKMFQIKDGTAADFQKILKNLLLVLHYYKSSMMPHVYHSFIFFN